MANDLLARFTDSALPAVQPESRELEPVEPSEPREIESRGRSPEEVVHQRETTRSEEPAEEPAPVEQYQPQPTYQPQPVYQQPQPPVPQVTNVSIAAAYNQIAEAITQDLVDNKLVEEDLVDAWPRTFKTMVGQLRFAFDNIFTLRAELAETRARLEQTIEYLRAKEPPIVEGQRVIRELNRQIDALIQRDPQFYRSLKDHRVRDQFVAFMAHGGVSKQEVTGPKAGPFLAKQFKTFNAAPTPNRFLGENSGGGGMLERMIANSGKLG